MWMLLARYGFTSALCLAGSSWSSAAAFHASRHRSGPFIGDIRMSVSSSSSSGNFVYRYPRPSVTVDTLIFCLEEEQVKLLLIKRGNDPFKNHWAIPGGFVNQDEGLDEAAARELKEETALDNLAFAQCGSYGDKNRDPRGHTVTVAYAAVVLTSEGIKAGDDAAEAKFFPLAQLPNDLAFDHSKIVKETWERLSLVPAENGQVVMERGTGKVLCTLPTPTLAEVVRKSKPFSPDL